MDERKLSDEKEIERLIRCWRRSFRWMLFVHYSLGTLGTICAITVASSPMLLEPFPIVMDTIAWLSAVCVAFVSFARLQRKGMAFHRAWDKQRNALALYRDDPTIPASYSYETRKDCQQIIRDGVH